MDRMTDTFLVPSYFISYFRHHSVHSVQQLNFWIIKSQLLRNKTHDVCLCVMCVLCDVCAVCDVCAWCVWRWWSHAVQRGVCLSGTHRVFLAGSRGSSPHIVLLLHSNISDFFFFFFFLYQTPQRPDGWQTWIAFYFWSSPKWPLISLFYQSTRIYCRREGELEREGGGRERRLRWKKKREKGWINCTALKKKKKNLLPPP